MIIQCTLIIIIIMGIMNSIFDNNYDNNDNNNYDIIIDIMLISIIMCKIWSLLTLLSHDNCIIIDNYIIIMLILLNKNHKNIFKKT